MGGFYGPKTRAAVAELQGAMGADATGVFDEALRAHLVEQLAVMRGDDLYDEPAPAPAPAPAAEPESEVQMPAVPVDEPVVEQPVEPSAVEPEATFSVGED